MWSAVFGVHRCHPDIAASALKHKSRSMRRQKGILMRDDLSLKSQKVHCIDVFVFYQASELSQLEPGEGTSVSLVMAQECGGD